MAITYKVAKLLSVCYWIVQYSPTHNCYYCLPFIECNEPVYQILLII